MTTITNIKRKFIFNNQGTEVELPDPSSIYSPKEVMRHYSGQYPTLVNATINDKGIQGEVYLYEFSSTAGTKG